MAPADVAASFVPEPAAPPGGSDVALLGAGIGTGLNGVMRRRAFFLGLHDAGVDFEGGGGGEGDRVWDDLEVRYLWCDRSVYEMPWGTWALRGELEEAKRQGKRMRSISVARLAGANHFVSWVF